MSEVLVFASAKDGVGKTVLATNMAAILANWGYKTLLIDTNIGSRNSDMRLGVENEIVYDLADIVFGTCRIIQAIIKHKEIPNLYFIPSPQVEGKAPVSPTAFAELLDELKKVFDYILIDSPSANSKGFLLSENIGNRYLLIMNPEFGGIRDLEAVKQRLLKNDKKQIFILLNKDFPDFYAEGLTPGRVETEDLLGLPVLGSISFSKEMHKWANRGLPISAGIGLDASELSMKKNLETITHRFISKVDDLAPDPHI